MSDAFDLEAELGGIVDSLNAGQVPYALCGGLALAVHGHPRATKDIDLLVEASEIEHVFATVKGAGFTLRAGPIPLGVATGSPQRLFRATKVSGGAHLTLDLLEVSEAYREAWASRLAVEWKGRQLSVVSRSGLVSMKLLSTRGKDLVDIETLQGPIDEG